MNASRLRELLDAHGLHLSRDLGQNFLVDAELAGELARRAGASPGDFVIEVGTGLGVLTRAIAARASRVRTVEIDSGLVRVLEAEQLLPANVELVHGDARRIDWGAWVEEAGGAPVRVIANLPYSVATPLLRVFLDYRDRLADWSVMIQSEVAARMTAATGEEDYGSLAVLHALTADVEILAALGPDRFFPRPKVDSSFVRVWPRKTPLLEAGELARVEPIVRAAFSQRRKVVTNGLARVAERRFPSLAKSAQREALEAVLRTAGIDPRLRPERIEPRAWVALSRALDAVSSADSIDPDDASPRSAARNREAPLDD
ncbi:MAG: ribosomal RNA small subunit methyltransferase A [Deltaproteobacteria bacterium]|nr:ribosomal RNA small subunit methyltransferase A [Deltaproteobacteria bacterium]